MINPDKNCSFIFFLSSIWLLPCLCTKKHNVKCSLTLILREANAVSASCIRQRLPIVLAAPPFVDSNYTKGTMINLPMMYWGLKVCQVALEKETGTPIKPLNLWSLINEAFGVTRNYQLTYHSFSSFLSVSDRLPYNYDDEV